MRVIDGMTAYFVQDVFGGPYGDVTASADEIDDSVAHELFYFTADV